MGRACQSIWHALEISGRRIITSHLHRRRLNEMTKRIVEMFENCNLFSYSSQELLISLWKWYVSSSKNLWLIFLERILSKNLAWNTIISILIINWNSLNIRGKNVLTVQKIRFPPSWWFFKGRLIIINKICNCILITPSKNNLRQMKACTRLNYDSGWFEQITFSIPWLRNSKSRRDSRLTSVSSIICTTCVWKCSAQTTVFRVTFPRKRKRQMDGSRFLLALYRQGVSNLRELELTAAWKTAFTKKTLSSNLLLELVQEKLHRMPKFAMKFFESKREEEKVRWGWDGRNKRKALIAAENLLHR